jgi:hypothetical protein
MPACHSPFVASCMAALHQHDLHAAVDRTRRGAQAGSPARTTVADDHDRFSPLTTFGTVLSAVQAVVVSLLVGRLH